MTIRIDAGWGGGGIDMGQKMRFVSRERETGGERAK